MWKRDEPAKPGGAPAAPAAPSPTVTTPAPEPVAEPDPAVEQVHGEIVEVRRDAGPDLARCGRVRRPSRQRRCSSRCRSSRAFS